MVFLVLFVQVPVRPEDRAALPGQPAIQRPQIRSGDTRQMTDIHDIRGPEQWGANPVWVTSGITGLVVLVFIMGLVWAIRRWKRKKADITRIIPEIFPEDTAYALLDEIKSLMQTDAKAYYFKLSEVLRGYLEKRFQIDAMEMTTEELLPRLMDMAIAPELKRDTTAFIRMSDPVKFAGASADMAQMEKHHELIHAFVRETTPGKTLPEQALSDPVE